MQFYWFDMLVFDSVLDGDFSWRHKVQSTVTSCNSKKPGICQESWYFYCVLFLVLHSYTYIVVWLDCNEVVFCVSHGVHALHACLLCEWWTIIEHYVHPSVCWLGIRKSFLPIKIEWRGAGVICMWSSWCHCHAIIPCFIKIQNGLTFLMPAYAGCPGKEAVKRVSVTRYSVWNQLAWWYVVIKV